MRVRHHALLNTTRRLLSTESSASNNVTKRVRKGTATAGAAAAAGPPLFTPLRAVALGTTVAAIYTTYEVNVNPKGTLGKMYRGSAFEQVMKSIYETIFGKLGEVFEPVSDKLLPDFPDAPCYSGVPPGTPAPPLLVLDLEKTLIGSEYDPRNGWRHVKRPGLDYFINSLSNYYEIVIFSENDVGIVQDILMAIDPEGKTHKLGSAAAEIRGTSVIKRLDFMNRDLARIILVDDNPDSFQLFPKNTLQVKPYNPDDKNDTVLYDLVPLLQAMVHEDARDFRATIDKLGTHEAEEAVVEYRMRLARRKAADEMKRNSGLGGVIRGSSGVERQLDDGSVRSSILSPKDIVGGGSSFASFDPLSKSFAGTASKEKDEGSKEGEKKAAAPAPTKKKGKLFQMLDEVDKAKEEDEKLRREKMNEIYMQRMQQKAKQQAVQHDDVN